ncbi:hypothetical protein CEXT_733781 [Caerostris extrusa]|uniref:Uncharacterized protein n=1 Tax=Caerostris extrusa TaxID=172846 RepID=A0AAV4WFX9_CAEEX|nr:hypothetical protein CEXT_733781 [Caerostris extrusa]
MTDSTYKRRHVIPQSEDLIQTNRFHLEFEKSPSMANTSERSARQLSACVISFSDDEQRDLGAETFFRAFESAPRGTEEPRQ